MVKNYSTGLKLFRNVYKNAAQEERMEVAIVLPIAAGKYSERLLETGWVMPKDYGKAAGKCSKILDSLWANL
jgi:hypothetical protein